MASLLEIQHLRVHFGSGLKVSRAVEEVSFTVREQETLCLVGESGSGKTVTALSILGLIPSPPGEIVSGKIFLDGQDLLTLGEEEMQKVRGREIAMVFQEPMTSLNPVFTIGDQIGETITVHEKASPDEVQRRTISLLADVGISTPSERLRDYPHQLSGGQRQRVMIAMALACNPRLVIADEPTTALDVTVQAQILHLFEELKAKRRMSLLYITHDLGVVASIADRICVMYAGVIVEEGESADIFHRPMHPYTRGLLASLPKRTDRGKKLFAIPGTVPDPASKPAGCPFHPRCTHAIDRCRAQFPGMIDLGDGHLSRCPVVATTGEVHE